MGNYLEALPWWHSNGSSRDTLQQLQLKYIYVQP